MFRHAALNRAYSLAWNDEQQTYVPAPETARRRGKRSGGASLSAVAAAAGALLGSGGAHALDANAMPTGGKVVAGQARIDQSGHTLTVDQSTSKAAIDWKSFSIGKNGTVEFHQPDSDSVALNRVTGQSPTEIFGALHANGQVFIVNSAGVLFAPGAQVDAAGIVASTRSISNADFEAGRYRFSGDSAGRVVNQGRIDAGQGGYVVLFGAQVENTGRIRAERGDIRLAAADQVTLKLDGGGLAGFTVDTGTLDALAANKGLIQADGGRIYLTADAIDQLAKAVVNNEGVIEARTVENRDGRIVLLADMNVGTTQVGGTLDASARQGHGGFVETSGAHVKIHGDRPVTTASAAGDAGTWLIDPKDFTVAASGGDMTGAQANTALASGNLTIQSTGGATNGLGDIHVNDEITWTANRLTLNAQRNIDIARDLHGSGTAQLSLQYGQASVSAGNTATYTLSDDVTIDLPNGNNLFTKLGSNGATKTFTVIDSLGAEGSLTGTDLQGIRGNLSGNYALGGNIDASPTTLWGNSGAYGFHPLGLQGTPFTGNFEGLGHQIEGLSIDFSIGTIGLFGEVAVGSRISNLVLADADVTGALLHTGGAVGRNYGTVDHVVVNGYVSGDERVGGVVGTNFGTVSNSRSSAEVSGGVDVGGLVGDNAESGVVSSSSSSSVGNERVGGVSTVGGLVGHNGGVIVDSHSSAGVYAEGDAVGGLIGENNAVLDGVYATGAVTGHDMVGGLIGHSTANVSNTHADGAVSGSDRVGGLIGIQEYGTVTASQASGAVQGDSNVGGLIGRAQDGDIGNVAASGEVTATGSWVGGLIGWTNVSQISDAHASGNVAGGNAVGGLIGMHAATNVATVSDAYATGSVSGNGSVGGLIGDAFYCSCDIDGSHATGQVTASGSYAGGLVGQAGGGTISNSYATGAVSGANYVGGLAGEAFNVTDSHATGSVTGGSSVGGLVGHAKMGGTVTGSYATGTVDGSGFNIGGLVGFNEGAVEGNSYATGLVGGYAYVGGLVGSNAGSVADSQTGHAGVVGSAVSGSEDVGGLVGVNNGSIANSTATGAVNSPGYVAGGLVGDNYGTIANSHASGAVNGYYYAGGLVGYNDSGASIVGSSASGAVAGDTDVGGFAGFNDVGATISDSSASGAVSGVSFGVGGFAGENWGSIASATSSGSVTSAEMSGLTGGFVGYNAGVATIGDSTASGVVAGGDYVGGFVGVNEASIDHSHATGAVGGGGSVGGFAGENYGPIAFSSATGNVSGGADGATGGFVGYNAGAIADSTATGNVVSLGGGVGGFAGVSQVDDTTGDLLRVSAAGSVHGVDDVGGLVGYNDAGVADSTATGAVVATGSHAGGLVGWNDVNAALDGNTAGGSVHGVGQVGGLVGLNAGSIVDNHATGAVTATGDEVGGFVGNSGGAISGSSATGNVAGVDEVGGFAGIVYGAGISESTASGTVAGSDTVGGFVGKMDWSAVISTASAGGAVSGVSHVGGFVGIAVGSSVAGSTAAGNVTASGDVVGGFAGSIVGDSHLDGAQATTGTVSGRDDVGGFIGYMEEGAISGSSSARTVAGRSRVGGFIGATGSSDTGMSITSSTASGNVSGTVSDVGGFVGFNAGGVSLSGNAVDGVAATGAVSSTGTDVGGFAGRNDGSITDVVAANTVSATTHDPNVGGIVGRNGGYLGNSRGLGAVTADGDQVGGAVGWNTGTIYGTYAAGAVTGRDSTGGLVGLNDGHVEIAYASGAVNGADAVGGLVGEQSASGSVLNAYATGSVHGADAVGGLFGAADGTAQYTYAKGAVSGTSRAGGYAGTSADADVSDSFYDTTTTGRTHSAGDYATAGEAAAAKTDAQMNRASTFAGWNLTAAGTHDTVWRSYDGLAAPLLTYWLTSLTATANGGDTSRVYDGTVHSGDAGPVTYSQTPAQGHLFGSASYATGLNVGTYTALGGQWSDQQGYDLAYVNNGSLTITPKALTATLVGVTKTYDGSTAAVLGTGNYSISGFVGGQGAQITETSGTYNSKDVRTATGASAVLQAGDYVANAGTLLSNYTLDFSANGGATITPRTVTATATAGDKVYDGTAAAQVANVTTSGFLDGDAVGVSASGHFADKNAGVEKTVTIDLATTGADASNYAFVAPITTSATISPKAINVGVTGVDKVYDGTTDDAVRYRGRGVVAGDSVGFAGDAAFDDKNVGNDKSIAVTDIHATGADAGNYVIATTSATTSADVTPRTIAVTATGVGKVYDGTTAGTALLGSSGVIAGDDLDFTGTAAYGDKNAGVDKQLNVSGIAVSGDDAGNYLLARTNVSTTATIARRGVATSAEALDKVYDGGTAVAVDASADGFVAGDAVSLATSGAFGDKNAGAGKAVEIDLALAGADAGNYVIDRSTVRTSADIARRPIDLVLTGSDKVYDGSTADAVSFSARGIVSGDQVAFSGRGVLADANAGDDKTVTVGRITATGADAGNYVFARTGTTTVDVARRDLTVDLLGNVTQTGGSLDATLSGSNFRVGNLAPGESISITETAGLFANASPGDGKAVTVDLSLADYLAASGTSLDNYNLVIGDLTGLIGTIVPSAPLVSAIVSLPNLPSGAGQAYAGVVASATGELDGGEAQGQAELLGAAQASAVSANTRENLLFRRTFSIGDGGIRLPQGVRGSEKDASQ